MRIIKTNSASDNNYPAIFYRSKIVIILLFFIIFFVMTLQNTVFASSDDYIKGYAEAVLNVKFNARYTSLSVKEGLITLIIDYKEDARLDAIEHELLKISGVVKVDIIKSETKSVQSMKSVDAEDTRSSGSLFPLIKRERLFRPLIADPRWPHFSIAYQYYFGDRELRNVAATSFGETLPLYRSNAAFGGEWQMGIQAAVFAVFDLDAESLDLINADYWVGIPLSYRKDKWSSLVRIYHQSSHLGDEYILRSRVDRINLSYEAINLKISYEPNALIRFYGGSDYIFYKEPSNLKPWSLQYGLELRSSKKYFHGALKPVAGADFKSRQESGWNTDVSLRAGFQIESIKMDWNTLHIMLEYFNGRSPNGQFYDRSIEYLSLATHFYFQ